jgi:hypothetical protein
MAYRLFNATTHTLAGKAMEQNDLTPRLYKLIDEVIPSIQ